MLSARITRLWTVGLLAAASAACFDIDLQGLSALDGPACQPPCDKPLMPYPPYGEFILVPVEQVNGLSYVGTIQVGDTVVFRLVGDYRPTRTPRDTITDVTWSLTDPAVGSIESDSSGSGTFVAGRPGRTEVKANERGPAIWACDEAGTMCEYLGWIGVEPPAP
jgi:hypothetical protein